MTDTINYNQLMQKALHRFVSDVLAGVMEDGLPGDHHFYISFDTTHPGADMSDALMERFPEEMTIVMQDWFENLAVMDDRFSVTLNFSNVPEPIVIPFAAIKSFADPSVEFGLEFQIQERPDGSEAGDEAGAPDPEAGTPPHEAEIVSLDTFRKH